MKQRVSVHSRGQTRAWNKLLFMDRIYCKENLFPGVKAHRCMNIRVFVEWQGIMFSRGRPTKSSPISPGFPLN